MRTKGTPCRQTTGRLADRQCPPAHHPPPAPRSRVRLADDPSTPSRHAQRRHARRLARLARPARAAGRAPRPPGPPAAVPGRLRQPASSPDGVPIHQLRQLLQWPRERFDTVLEALRAAQPLTSRPSRSRPATPKPSTTATRSMANAIAASAGAPEQRRPVWAQSHPQARGARLSAATSLQ